MSNKTISIAVLNVLLAATITDNKLFLPDRQLDRKLYTDVNKVLTALGGKWNRSAKAHVFADDPTDKIEQAVQTGSYTDTKKQFQFFETPPEVVEMVHGLAGDLKGLKVCEPSAGKGNIINPLDFPALGAYLTCIELQPENCEHLSGLGYAPVINMDFLDYDQEQDVFIANPPFSGQQDIDHVNHMLDLATTRVVSVMSKSVLWRDNAKAKSFRARIERLGGEFKLVDSGAFKASGTMVETVIVVVNL